MNVGECPSALVFLCSSGKCRRAQILPGYGTLLVLYIVLFIVPVVVVELLVPAVPRGMNGTAVLNSVTQLQHFDERLMRICVLPRFSTIRRSGLS